MLYSFVVPIYNDGALARSFCVEMASVFRSYLGHDDLARELEVIFVDDGSQNDSPQLIKQACDEFSFAKAVLLSRNFGQHIATSAGYRAARGDYVGTLNVDMEEPPACLPPLLDALKQGGHDIAGGQSTGRTVGTFTRFTSWLFVKVMNRLTGANVPLNGTTVRIMTRRAVDVYNSLTETSRYIPGLENWLGLAYVRVPIEAQPRKQGRSSYNFRRRLRMAYRSVISFSDFPLRTAVKFGMFIASVGMLLGLGLIVQKVFGASLLPGYTSTFVLIVFLGGVQIAVTGVASLYIGRILAEVQQRPLFVVRETYGDVQAFDAPILRGNVPPPVAAAPPVVAPPPVAAPRPVEKAPRQRKKTA